MKTAIKFFFLILMNYAVAQVTDTGDKVGIGITTPTSKLHLFDTSSTALRVESPNMTVELQAGMWGADLQLGRFQTDRFAGVIYANSKTFGISKQWFAGIRAGDSDYHIFSETGLFTAFKINQTSGNVSIGNTNNTYKLDVTGSGRFSGTLWANDRIILANNKLLTFVSYNYHDFYIGSDNAKDALHIGYGNAVGDNVQMTFDKATNRVGIGTTTPDSKLTVAGNIHAQEVKVTVNAGADFVFHDDYILPSLKSIEKFIKENRHLPEIASEKDMQENGLFLADMNIKLLQKIEELTLYTIEQEKKLESQDKTNQELKARLLRLEQLVLNSNQKN